MSLAESIQRQHEPSVMCGNREAFLYRHHDGWNGTDYLRIVDQHGREWGLGMWRNIILAGKPGRIHIWEHRRIRSMKREWDWDKIECNYILELYPETASDKKIRLDSYARCAIYGESRRAVIRRFLKDSCKEPQ